MSIYLEKNDDGWTINKEVRYAAISTLKTLLKNNYLVKGKNDTFTATKDEKTINVEFKNYLLYSNICETAYKAKREGTHKIIILIENAKNQYLENKKEWDEILNANIHLVPHNENFSLDQII